MILGKRIGPYYIGRCTRTHHWAILRSGFGTYCWWHRHRNLQWDNRSYGDYERATNEKP